MRDESPQRQKSRRRLHRALVKLAELDGLNVTAAQYAAMTPQAKRAYTLRLHAVRRAENDLAAAVVAERRGPDVVKIVRERLGMIG